MWNHEKISASGFVLAGGRSSRMGFDKALALFAGRSLLEQAMGTVDALGITVSIAGFRSAPPKFEEWTPEIFLDTWPDAGPLGGVHASLSTTQSEWNLFLTVDSPLMPAALPAYLLQRAILSGDPVNASSLHGNLEPFPVVLHRSSLSSVTQCLGSGRRACRAAWQTISSDLHRTLSPAPVEHLLQSGKISHPQQLPPTFWFESANTPAQLDRLNRIHKLPQGMLESPVS